MKLPSATAWVSRATLASEASLVWLESSSALEETVTLTGSGSDAGGTIAAYGWDFTGVGTFTSASGPAVPTTFAEPSTTLPEFTLHRPASPAPHSLV